MTPSFVRRRIARVGVAVGVLLAPSTGGAATALYEITGDGQLGWSVASMGDVNGDHVPDFAAGAPAATGALGEPDAGEVRVFSGATGSPVGALVGLLRGDRGAQLGRAIAAVGDLNGDGTPDLAAGAPGNDQFCELSGGDPGYVAIFSGADGAILRRIDGESQAECFGSVIAALADVDGDGVSDLLVGAPGRVVHSPGSARVYSGADGAEIRRHTGEGPTDNFGWSLTGLADVDGDGVGDYAVGTPFFGREPDACCRGVVVVYSGATGAEISRLTGKQRAFLGETLASAGLPEGLGGAHLLVGTSAAAPLRDRALGLRLRKGKSKTVLSVVHPTDSYGAHASQVTSVGDLDGDGRAEAVIGGDAGWTVLTGRHALPVISDAYRGVGSDGDPSWLAPAGDVTGDGVPDLLVGHYPDSTVRVFALHRVPASIAVNVRVDLTAAAGVTGQGRLVVQVKGANVKVKVKLTGFPAGIYTLFLGTPFGPFRSDILYATVGSDGKGVAVFAQSRFLPEYWGTLSVLELADQHVYVSGPDDGPTDVLLEGTIPHLP